MKTTVMHLMSAVTMVRAASMKTVTPTVTATLTLDVLATEYVEKSLSVSGFVIMADPTHAPLMKNALPTNGVGSRTQVMPANA